MRILTLFQKVGRPSLQLVSRSDAVLDENGTDNTKDRTDRSAELVMTVVPSADLEVSTLPERIQYVEAWTLTVEHLRNSWTLSMMAASI